MIHGATLDVMRTRRCCSRISKIMYYLMAQETEDRGFKEVSPDIRQRTLRKTAQLSGKIKSSQIQRSFYYTVATKSLADIPDCQVTCGCRGGRES